MAVNEKKYNILVIGKTGVGKSSFVNYFLGQDVAKTGTGKPVTERGLHEFSFEMEGFPVVLYDSWGLEVGKYQEWTEKFSVELKKRGIDKPATEWFHSVFYCIAAGGHRVEDADLEIIRLLQREKYPVSVVLTKCDMIGPKQEEKIKSSLREALDNINAIPMSSGGENRSGPIEPFGIEAIRQQAKDDFFSGIAMRLPDHLRERLRGELEAWERSVMSMIQNAGYTDKNEVQKEIDNISRKMISTIENAMSNDLESTLRADGQIMSVAHIPAEYMEPMIDEKNAETPWLKYAALILDAAIAVIPPTVFSPQTVLNSRFALAKKLATEAWDFIQKKGRNQEDLQKAFSENFQRVGDDMRRWIAEVEKGLDELRKQAHGSQSQRTS